MNTVTHTARHRSRTVLISTTLMLAFLSLTSVPSQAQAGGNLPAATSISAADENSWAFAVSGDSRNCGNVVMPAIAAAAERSGAAFYWHLGDFRKISGMDEDIAHEPERRGDPLTMPEYEALAWDDIRLAVEFASASKPRQSDSGSREVKG